MENLWIFGYFLAKLAIKIGSRETFFDANPNSFFFLVGNN